MSSAADAKIPVRTNAGLRAIRRRDAYSHAFGFEVTNTSVDDTSEHNSIIDVCLVNISFAH